MSKVVVTMVVTGDKDVDTHTCGKYLCDNNILHYMRIRKCTSYTYMYTANKIIFIVYMCVRVLRVAL